MSDLRIELESGSRGFEPKSTLSGTASWSVSKPLEEVSLRLFWYTQGKGDQDVEIVAEERFRNPGQSERREFSFALPEGPYSFSGKLISLLWALELVAQPGGATHRQELVVAPGGQELVLAR